MYGQIHKLDCGCDSDFSNCWVRADAGSNSRKLLKYTEHLHQVLKDIKMKIVRQQRFHQRSHHFNSTG